MKPLLRAVVAIMIAFLPRCVFAQQPIKTTSEPTTTNNGWREITSEEARDLLKSFLKRRGGDNLEKYDPVYPDGTRYPAFYFFEAILGASPGPVGVLNVRYYAVDRQTGEVWNAVICERVTSSSLTRAQVALRRRIGLMDADYRKIKKLGPLCEPGYPRVGPVK
jgi:hypothetical protein